MSRRKLRGALGVGLAAGVLVLLLPWTAVARPAESASTSLANGTWSVSYQSGQGSGTWSAYCPPYGILCTVTISGTITNTSTSGCYYVQAIVRNDLSVQLLNSPKQCGHGSRSFSLQASVLRVSGSVSVRVCRDGGGCGSQQRIWPRF
jgi:hypothetical protein